MLRKSIIGVLIAIFLTGLLSNVWIHFSYDANMPQQPDPVNGRTVRMKINHGDVVYVTPAECKRADFIFGPIFFISFGAGFCLALVRLYWDDPNEKPRYDSRLKV